MESSDRCCKEVQSIDHRPTKKQCCQIFYISKGIAGVWKSVFKAHCFQQIHVYLTEKKLLSEKTQKGRDMKLLAMLSVALL